MQPGQPQEVLLHETAVAWLRNRLSKSVPAKAWEESVQEYRTRLRSCAAHVNQNYDVDSLCRDLPARLRDLHRRGGDRLAH